MLDEVREYAARLGDEAVEREAAAAVRNARAGLLTEAGIRLGRCVEAAIYSTARELGVDLVYRTIDLVEGIVMEIAKCESQIVRKQGTVDVRSLSGPSKLLAECIARLTESEELRSGIESSRPRPNEQIFRELIGRIDPQNAGIRRRLSEVQDVLREVQEVRNAAAHAALDGQPRELRAEDLQQLVDRATDFIIRLFDARLGLRARVPAD